MAQSAQKTNLKKTYGKFSAYISGRVNLAFKSTKSNMWKKPKLDSIDKIASSKFLTFKQQKNDEL